MNMLSGWKETRLIGFTHSVFVYLLIAHPPFVMLKCLLMSCTHKKQCKWAVVWGCELGACYTSFQYSLKISLSILSNLGEGRRKKANHFCIQFSMPWLFPAADLITFLLKYRRANSLLSWNPSPMSLLSGQGYKGHKDIFSAPS